jgi:hypothetical protein
MNSGLQIEGVLPYFMHLKCQKRIGDDVGVVGYIFTKPKKIYQKNINFFGG